MKKGLETLFSKYIIDGVTMDSTPADMLKECVFEDDWAKFFPSLSPQSASGTIIDETPDRDASPLKYSVADYWTYLEAVMGKLDSVRRGHNSVNIKHPKSSVRILLAESILDCLWRKNPARLDSLSLELSILWDSDPVGHMAAFHSAIDSVCGYIYELGLNVKKLRLNDLVVGGEDSDAETVSTGSHEINFKVVDNSVDAGQVSEAKNDCPETGDSQLSGCTYKDISESNATDGVPTLLMYIPFDTCPHKLGGSLLGQVLGKGDEAGLEIADPDYFIDSFEVVRDLVEDGVVLSGVSVGRGGLVAAVDRILGEDFRIELDVSGVQRAYIESDQTRILFSEIPGVLIRIPVEERGYVDSQLMLQDIAYYIVGQVVERKGGERKLSLSAGNGRELSRLLSSLISGPLSEDPDLSNFSEGIEHRPQDD